MTRVKAMALLPQVTREPSRQDHGQPHTGGPHSHQQQRGHPVSNNLLGGFLHIWAFRGSAPSLGAGAGTSPPPQDCWPQAWPRAQDSPALRSVQPPDQRTFSAARQEVLPETGAKTQKTNRGEGMRERNTHRINGMRGRSTYRAHTGGEGKEHPEMGWEEGEEHPWGKRQEGGEAPSEGRRGAPLEGTGGEEHPRRERSTLGGNGRRERGAL